MTIEPITTKQHFKNIITECIDNYEISSIDYEKPWTDIDPIQPFGFEYQQKEGFHKWLSTKHPSIYNTIVDICNREHTRIQVTELPASLKNAGTH